MANVLRDRKTVINVVVAIVLVTMHLPFLLSKWASASTAEIANALLQVTNRECKVWTAAGHVPGPWWSLGLKDFLKEVVVGWHLEGDKEEEDYQLG